MTNREPKALFVTQMGAARAALIVCRARGMADAVIATAVKLHKVVRRGQMMGYEAHYVDGMLVRPVYESEV